MLLLLVAALLAGSPARAALSSDVDDLLGRSRRTPEIVGAYISTGYWDLDEVEQTMAALGSLGVNFVIDYGLVPPDGEVWEDALDRYLDLATDNGIGVAFPIYGALEGMRPDAPDGRSNATVELVARLKHYRGIAAWYVHDEVLPWVNGDGGTQHYSMSLPQMQELYRAIRAEDPRRPQINVWHTLPSRERFEVIYSEEHLPFGEPPWLDDEEHYERAMRKLVQTTCDWVLVDMYPVGAPWLGQDAVPAQMVASLVARAKDLKRSGQPLYFVFQAFSWAQYRPEDSPDATYPTALELELMLAAAYGNGATGAIAYSWFDLADCPPERDLPGSKAALARLKDTLSALSSTGWPATNVE